MPPLSRERILRTAIRVADREGLEAVSLRRVATELGVHVTSLYNHVPTRDAVTDAMVEVLLEEAKLPTGPVAWETWVRRFFDAVGTIAATHPGAFAVLEQRPVQGARAAASFEVALAAFTRAGFTATDAYAAVKTVVYLSLAVGVERSMLARGDMPETDVADLPVEAFPLLRAIAADTVPEEAWAFSLDALLAGLRVQLRRRRSRGGS